MLTVLNRVTKARIEALELDASISEEHGATNAITAHPVERGVAIADHIRPEPETLTMEGIVSNTPVGPAEENADTAPGSPGRAEAAFAKLMELRDAGALVTVVTGLRSYENMAIQSLRVPRNAKIGDALRFTVTLRRVQVAQLQTVAAVRTARPNGKTRANLGKQVTSPATQAQRARSVLDRMAETSGLYKALGVD